MTASSRRLHVASYLTPGGIAAAFEGGAARDRAITAHLGTGVRRRVHLLGRGPGYPGALAGFLERLLRARGATFYLQYPRLPAPLEGLAGRTLGRVFVRALRRASRRNHMVWDVSDLPLEQARDLDLPSGRRRRRERAFERFEREVLFGLPAAYVFASRSMAEYATARYGLDERRVQVAVNGAPAPRPPLPRERLEDLLGERLGADTLLLVYAGTLDRGRGVAQLLEAVSRVERPLRLLLLGTGGGWLDTGRSDGRVRHLGPVEEATCQEVVGACDVGLIPYDPARPYMQLAYPTKLSLYLVQGVPVLSTPVREVERALAHTGAGWCVPFPAWPTTLGSITPAALTEASAAARSAGAALTWSQVLAGVRLGPEVEA